MAQKNNSKQVKLEDVIIQDKAENVKEQEGEKAETSNELRVKKAEPKKKVEVIAENTTSKSETIKLDNKKVNKTTNKAKKTEEKTKKTEQIKSSDDAVNLENQQKANSKKENKKKQSDNKTSKVHLTLFKKKKVEEPIKPVRVKRVRTDVNYGLTSDQVNERVTKGQTNETPNQSVKTYKKIFLENTLTFFNVLCLAIAISLICVGAWSNCLFMSIIIINTTIGIIQEIKAKKTIEKLSLLTAPSVKVLRDGVEETITTNEVVIDDILILSNGKQIVSDSSVVEGSIEVNESMLTGESLPIKKKVGDTIYAGSFVVSGNCKARVEKVGKNNYIQQLAAKAKQYKRPKSELFNSLKMIIKV